MPKTSFKAKIKRPEVDDIFDYMKLQDIGNLTIDNRDARLLRHTVRNPNGDIIAQLTCKDPSADDSNSVLITDPAYYWFFYDMAVCFEEEYKLGVVKINCDFHEDQIPPREV